MSSEISVFVFVLELIGTAAFAVSGAMIALRRGMDLLGVCVMGLISACGGGLRPYRYRPAHGRYAGMELNGLLLLVENEDAFYPVTAGVIMFAAILQRHRRDFCVDARPEWLDKLAGSTALRDALATDSLSSLFSSWISDQDEYLHEKVNLYHI